MLFLERLLDSSLLWYTSICGSNYRPRSHGDTTNRQRQCQRRFDSENPTEARLRENILDQIFELLANLAWSSDALSFFAKVPPNTQVKSPFC